MAKSKGRMTGMATRAKTRALGKSSSSMQTADSITFARVLPLGEKLVEELGLENSVDTLGRWMAHYVAQLIDEAKRAKGESRAEAERKAFQAILDLWRHRHSLPHLTRPFEELESIIEVIQGLSPSTPHYYRADVLGRVQPSKEPEAVAKWLSLIRDVDRTARALIEDALKRAVAAAGPKPSQCIELESPNSDFWDAKLVVIRIIRDSENNERLNRVVDQRRIELQERLESLDGLLSKAAILKRELSDELAAMHEVNTDPKQ